MQEALDQLHKKLSGLSEPPDISDKQWQEFASHCTIALAAGGSGTRFTVPGSENVNKNSFKLPNGDTMTEMTVRMYRDAGIKRFVMMVFYNAHTLEELLGDGSVLGVEIKYSYDPQKQVGRGGAVRHMLDNHLVPGNHYLIVQNPDDLILDFPGSFPRYIAAGHLRNIQKGDIATVVAAPSLPYPATGMKIVDDQIRVIEMYPQIPVPAHIGVTVFSPEVFGYFDKLFDYKKKMDFEAVLFPELVKEGKLGAVGLLKGKWLAVNDLKSYNQLCEYLGLK